MEKTTFQPQLETFFDKRIQAKSSKEWLTTEEAAEFLGISPGSLRNMTCNGSVPYYKLGRRNRYKLSELVELFSRPEKGA